MPFFSLGRVAAHAAALAICLSASVASADVYLYTGSPQNVIVPAGMNSVTVKMWGAGGGPRPIGSEVGFGGGGAFVSGTLLVVPGGNGAIILNFSSAAVPEPASLSMLAIGGAALLQRRKTK